jgi:hypothetical protein
MLSIGPNHGLHAYLPDSCTKILSLTNIWCKARISYSTIFFTFFGGTTYALRFIIGASPLEEKALVKVLRPRGLNSRLTTILSGKIMKP